MALHILLLAMFFILHTAILKRYLASERRILLFHIGLFIFLPFCSIAIKSQLGGQIISLDFFLIYGISAIYSLSFLELWSLTEGSYSLQILNALQAGINVRDLGSSIGHQKQVNRLKGMTGLGLIQEHNNVFEVSRIGWLIALMTSFLAWTAGAKLRE